MCKKIICIAWLEESIIIDHDVVRYVWYTMNYHINLGKSMQDYNIKDIIISILDWFYF